jgi:hypothetical protein
VSLVFGWSKPLDTAYLVVATIPGGLVFLPWTTLTYLLVAPRGMSTFDLVWLVRRWRCVPASTATSRRSGNIASLLPVIDLGRFHTMTSADSAVGVEQGDAASPPPAYPSRISPEPLTGHTGPVTAVATGVLPTPAQHGGRAARPA